MIGFAGIAGAMLANEARKVLTDVSMLLADEDVRVPR